MNTRARSIGQRLGAVTVILCGVAGIQAAGAPVATTTTGTPEVQALRGAYLTLYVADHDYKGHRIHAMHALELACDLLGTDIRGDGKGHESQSISDAQLQHAEQTIQQVRSGIVAAKQPRVLKHLDAAIADIALALQTK